ncbi:MAG: anhydro-N-acetylmuramic acid kinase [Planctomycetota bacterium]
MDSNPPRVRYVVGCMSGTSLDGLDAALTKITGTGLDMTAEFVGMVNAPLPAPLRTTLMSMANGEPHPPIEYMRAARYLGVVHAEAVAELLAKHGDNLKPDFVVAHGQTIWHAPADRLSWQLFDPWPIVRTLNLPVCYDLRQADLVAGGEGAPITPIADWVMYREKADVVLNLGGIANVTRLVKKSSEPTGWHVRGFDIGPCNLLLDFFCRQLTGQRFDRDGVKAGEGTLHCVETKEDKTGSMYLDFISKITPMTDVGESFGREDFSDEMLSRLLEPFRETYSPQDILRNAVEAVSQLCGAVCCSGKRGDIALAGGGARNKTLISAITSYVKGYEVYDHSSDTYTPYAGRVILSDDLGIPCEAREAMGFAVLGALSADGVPITLPQVTGAESPGVAGVWVYPDGPPRV